MAVKEAHQLLLTIESGKDGFRGVGLIPLDPNMILERLNFMLPTPMPTLPPSVETNLWVSQTPHKTTNALS